MGRRRGKHFIVFAVGFVFVTVAVTGCGFVAGGAWFHKPKTAEVSGNMAADAVG